MSAQSEALRLADALEISSNHGMRREAAAELRRQHQEIKELRQYIDGLLGVQPLNVVNRDAIKAVEGEKT